MGGHGHAAHRPHPGRALGQGQIGFLKGVKCALAEMGLIQNVLAAPFAPFAGRERAQVKAALKKLVR